MKKLPWDKYHYYSNKWKNQSIVEPALNMLIFILENVNQRLSLFSSFMIIIYFLKNQPKSTILFNNHSFYPFPRP